MSNPRAVSVRIDQSLLDVIDAHCQSQSVKRSRYMAQCAVKQAKRINKGKKPLYLENDIEPENPTTITVSLSARREELIQEACAKVNHKISTFIVWATQANLEQQA